MASLYDMKDIYYDAMSGTYFYKGKAIPKDKAIELKKVIKLNEIRFKIESDFNLPAQWKEELLEIFEDVLLWNDMKEQTAIIYNRYKRVFEHMKMKEQKRAK